MSLRVVFRIAARLEFEEAAIWYNEQRRGLGEEFLREIDELVFRTSEYPARYPVVFADIRRAIARRFPYSVIFRTRSNTLVVLAVFHSRRDPRVWQRRVEPLQTVSDLGSSMKTKNIRQSVTIKASPSDVYEALMDQKKHAKFTRHPAKISRKVGGKFSAFDGYCEGIHLELVEGEKIVQTWRASDWPKDAMSTATFFLSKIPSGTKLVFTQTGVPEKQWEGIKKGWKEFYWVPMKKMLEAQP